MIHIFDNFNSALQKLELLISYDEERGRPYFVDNSFFNNKYDLLPDLIYYCIKEREVSKWDKFSNFSNSNDKKYKNTNLINFYDFKIQK